MTVRSLLLALAASTLCTPALAANPATIQIVVSKQTQSLTVYEDGKAVANSRVSTGKEGHDTPSGIFSIIQKAKYHESNLYSNAPMPWMQRLTWSGIALHESSSVPNFPASHGCVRLPAEFARKLYAMTALGAHVVITDQPVAPAPIGHPMLFFPERQQQGPQLLSDAQLRGVPPMASKQPVEVAMAEPAAPQVDIPDVPLRILITLRGQREMLHDVQEQLLELGFETGGVDGQAGKLTRDAIQGFKRWKNLPLKGPMLTPELLAALREATGRPVPPAGQILIRRKFAPVTEQAIVIDQPDKPLGTHLLEATKVNHATGDADWQAMTLEQAPGQTLTAVMDRIHIPEELRETVEHQLAAGTSITISDHGLGDETADGTDFITVLSR
ncbi:L,D-transpeptidase family protein [Rhizobium paknamense]|uniref:Peptidoglycan hydrolase-like protein with peptidoglycan-binding domain n=1 Tax=Rhizobium paknamense TaxID=1206817 RepID=A0ABU0I6Z0_9HYPH|nr:L,D-transpeptidase family protein [Rhizobium paknamense]MDQ0454000.1 peptidoglycan hydrolase-like protein with peptidoglycan-binding domain [Rhizobium paknamense]